MNREEFERLREKNKQSRTTVTWTVYGICFFCAVLTFGYFVFGIRINSPQSKTVPVKNETGFGGARVATPTVTPTSLKGNTRDEPDSSIIVK